jgi:hypothetical protein
MRAAKNRSDNYGDQERRELLEHASRTLAESIPGLPESEPVAQACIYLLKHLSGEYNPPLLSTLVMNDRIANRKPEFVISA